MEGGWEQTDPERGQQPSAYYDKDHISFPSCDDPPMGRWKSKVFLLKTDDGCRVIITHQKH